METLPHLDRPVHTGLVTADYRLHPGSMITELKPCDLIRESVDRLSDGGLFLVSGTKGNP